MSEGWHEISLLLPHPSGSQRGWIDGFYQGSKNLCGGRPIVDAKYGHCQDYPKGFMVKLGPKES